MRDDDDRGLPERALWVAVIFQAISDYILHQKGTAPRSRGLYYDARWWLFEEKSGRWNSFSSLCGELNLDVAAFRRRILGLSPLEFRKLRSEFSRRQYVEAPSPVRRRYGSSRNAAPHAVEKPEHGGDPKHRDTVRGDSGRRSTSLASRALKLLPPGLALQELPTPGTG